jgi:cytochrome b561
MNKFSKPAITLHWLVAILIVAAFILGEVMTDIPGLTPTKLKYFSWHKWLGVTVLGLVAVRLLWRLASRPPDYPDSMPLWMRRAAAWLHALLYVLMFAVPISGYLYSLAAGVPVVYLGVLPLPAVIDPNPAWKPVLKEAHELLTTVLLWAFCLHVAAALKHQFIDRDGILKRMLP